MDRVARIFIVDDHPIVRRGLASLIELEPDLTVCGEADTLDGAARKIAELRPDLVIADLSLGQEDGTGLIRLLRERFSDLPVLVVTMHEEPRNVRLALQSGARGYVTKREATKSVLVAIRTVLGGGTWLGGSTLEKDSPTIADPPDVLTPRELEVFLLIGRGLSTQRIADELALSGKSVETRCDRIKRKLVLRDGRQLAQVAIHWVLRHGEDRMPSI